MMMPLQPDATIGIIGAGQLGKMLAQSAQKMGYRIATYDPNPKACAFPVSNWHQVGSFDDEKSLIDFSKKVDVVTYEFENINAQILKTLHSEVNLPQGTDLLLTSQDRVLEKKWLNEMSVATAPFWEIRSFEDLEAALIESGFPAILKTTRFGYDGKGQIVIYNQEQLSDDRDSLAQMLQSACILEGYCAFDKEVSVMVARDQYGTIETFPISRNIHRKGILFSSQVPAELSSTAEEKIQKIAKKIAKKANLIGVLGIEFFLLSKDEVVVNEVAPRPHNSGHYTIEACNVSQFDQHILAVSGHKLSPIKLLKPALMFNILGQDVKHVSHIWEKYPEAVVHLYQKGEAKKNRKMGHLTIVDNYFEKYDSLRKNLENSNE